MRSSSTGRSQIWPKPCNLDRSAKILILGRRSITSLPSLNPLDRFLAFDPSTFTLTQIICVSPKCWLNVFLKILAQLFDFPFQRVSLKAGHPLLTSLSTQKKPFSQGPATFFGMNRSKELNLFLVLEGIYQSNRAAAVPYNFLSNISSGQLQPCTTISLSTQSRVNRAYWSIGSLAHSGLPPIIWLRRQLGLRPSLGH